MWFRYSSLGNSLVYPLSDIMASASMGTFDDNVLFRCLGEFSDSNSTQSSFVGNGEFFLDQLRQPDNGPSLDVQWGPFPSALETPDPQFGTSTSVSPKGRNFLGQRFPYSQDTKPLTIPLRPNPHGEIPDNQSQSSFKGLPRFTPSTPSTASLNASIDNGRLPPLFTTLYFHSVPQIYMRHTFLRDLMYMGGLDWGDFDFYHMPLNPSGLCNCQGYLFINFTSHEVARRILFMFHGHYLQEQKYPLKVYVSRCQGIEDNVRQYIQRNPVGASNWLEPWVFDGPLRIPVKEKANLLFLDSEFTRVDPDDKVLVNPDNPTKAFLVLDRTLRFLVPTILLLPLLCNILVALLNMQILPRLSRSLLYYICEYFFLWFSP